MLVEKKEIQPREVVVERYVLCDKCGERVRLGNYDAFNFKFEYKTGEAYPEGGDGDKWTLDVCPKCAPKLIELLSANGYRVQQSEWDTY